MSFAAVALAAAYVGSCAGGSSGSQESSSYGLKLEIDEPIEVAVDESGHTEQAERELTVVNEHALARPFMITPSVDWIEVVAGRSGILQPGERGQFTIGFDGPALAALGAGTHSGEVSVGDPRQLQLDPLVLTIQAVVGNGEGRVTEGLLALYEFEEGSGTVLHDSSDAGDPLDLEIADPSTVIWQPGRLVLVDESDITSPGPASKIIDACKLSRGVTIEAWVTAESPEQNGPARIVTISDGSMMRNVTLGHGGSGSEPDTAYSLRLRTTQTTENGIPALITGSDEVPSGLHHVAFTRSRAGRGSLYVDGQLRLTGAMTGDLADWDDAYRLALGNEVGGGRPWYGSLHLVAIYGHPIGATGVAQNYAAGPGDEQAGSLVVTPSSDFYTSTELHSDLSGHTKDYEVRNDGTDDVSWSASPAEGWAHAMPPSGMLVPGQSETVTIGFNEGSVEGLDVGNHTSAIAWSNTTNGFGNLETQVHLSLWEPGSTSGEKPGPHNTGPSNPDILVPTGSLTITEDGTVIENVDISGPVRIEANNVTLRNFRINAGYAPYGVHAGLDWSGTVLEDGEISHVSSAAIFGKGFTARRLNIRESKGDGIKARGDVLVEGCWIHHLGHAVGAHADGNQTRVGDNLVFRGNNFDMPIPESENGEAGYLSNAGLIIQDSLGTIDNFLIEENWLNGGNYMVFVTPNNPGGITNLSVINNRFGRDYRYGLILTGGIDMVISGNVWDDTGQPIEENNQ